MRVRKAVITAAGLGTRFLPATKAQPKEMLPLVDKPLIQYAVEEAAASGIEQVIIVICPGRESIKKHFESAPELEGRLKAIGKAQLLTEVRRLSKLAEIAYVVQEKPLGLGHAVLMAKELVGKEPFAVMLPDDIISNDVPALKQLLNFYDRYKSSVVAVEIIDRKDAPRYGIIKSKAIAERVYQVTGLVEKPQPSEAPSDLAIVGRYILTPGIFEAITAAPAGKGGEIQLTDALQLLLKKEKIYAYEFKGTRYDTGTPAGWLKASIAHGLRHPEIGLELREYLKKLR